MAQVSFGSINEENVYQVLTRMKVEFRYQVSLGGGRDIRGGQVVDFIVYVPPQPVALYIQGSFWHGGAKQVEDQLKQAQAERMGYRVVALTEEETKTPETARAALQRKVL